MIAADCTLTAESTEAIPNPQCQIRPSTHDNYADRCTMTSEGQTLLEPCSTTRRLPQAVRDGLSPAASLRAAEEVAARLTRQHYENFSVISWVLPRHLRQDFCNIYAFCRVADDLSDEVHAP